MLATEPLELCKFSFAEDEVGFVAWLMQQIARLYRDVVTHRSVN